MPAATGANTHMHTQTCTTSVFAQRHAQARPWITQKKEPWECVYSRVRVSSNFIKQHLSCAVCLLYFYSCLLCVCGQVAGPPPAGAFQERPSKPTMFRKFYERGEFPMALEHDTKGNRIAWKVGTITLGKQFSCPYLVHFLFFPPPSLGGTIEPFCFRPLWQILNVTFFRFRACFSCMFMPQKYEVIFHPPQKSLPLASAIFVVYFLSDALVLTH